MTGSFQSLGIRLVFQLSTFELAVPISASLAPSRYSELSLVAGSLSPVSNHPITHCHMALCNSSHDLVVPSCLPAFLLLLPYFFPSFPLSFVLSFSFLTLSLSLHYNESSIRTVTFFTPPHVCFVMCLQ